MKRVIRKVDPSGGIGYDETLVNNLYYKYRVDKVVYMEESKESAVSFFSHLYNHNEYSEFSKLCIHLLTISPDSVECERAISNLNTLKNNYHTCLTPRHRMPYVWHYRRDQQTNFLRKAYTIR